MEGVARVLVAPSKDSARGKNRIPVVTGVTRRGAVEAGVLRAVAYVVGDGRRLGSVPEGCLSGRGSRWSGSATPIEMMYLRAASTLISSGMVSARGTMRKKPAVMLGVVGTNTEICSRP